MTNIINKIRNLVEDIDIIEVLCVLQIILYTAAAILWIIARVNK